MIEELENQTSWKKRERLVERLDHMVESGRVTEDEANRLRAASGPAEFDDATRSISVRHAKARLDAAVEDGGMSQEEADGFLARLRNGEHPRSLRAHLGKFRSRPRSSEA